MTNNDEPSATALTAAAARAAHLIVDSEPLIFVDELASVLLADRADELISYHRLNGEHLVLSAARAQATCRSRYAEDHLADSVRGGRTQYVILGAGLDSFGYRSGLARQVRVFEVDQPATQQWKRRNLSAAQIAIPDQVTFVPVDFETDSLPARLAEHGFDPSLPALVSWLGVTMYLTRAAIGQILAAVGTFAPGTELITDYMLPAGLRDAAGDTYVELVAPAAAQRGEPWLSFFTPDEMSALLERHGLRPVEHVPQREAVEAGMWHRADSLSPAALSVLARAAVRG